MSDLKPTGPVAGLDLGKARVGLAVSDELRRLAHPRASLDGRQHRRLLEQLRQLVDEEGVCRFIIGWPLDMSGHPGTAAQRAARFAQQLADATGVEVELVDERWTTVQAERELRAMGTTGRRARAKVDGVAAALILQQWLDRQPGPERDDP